MAPSPEQRSTDGPPRHGEHDDQGRKIRRIRALLAINSRYHPDDPHTDTLRGELRMAKLEQAILRTVAGWPPLTEEQRRKLAALLGPASSTTDRDRGA